MMLHVNVPGWTAEQAATYFAETFWPQKRAIGRWHPERVATFALVNGVHWFEVAPSVDGGWVINRLGPIERGSPAP